MPVNNEDSNLPPFGLTAKQEREMKESDTVSICQEDKFCLQSINDEQ